MSKSKYYLVARREYLENLRTKAFWIGILSFPIILGLVIGVPLLMVMAKETRSYAVLDQSGFLLEAVEDRVLADDLPDIFSAAERLVRRDGQEPQLLKELAKVLTTLNEEERAAFAELLAQSNPDPQRLEALPEAAGLWIRAKSAELRQWWQTATDEEFERLRLRLTRTDFRRSDVSITDLEETRAELNSMIDDGRLFAYFVVGTDPVAGAEGCEYVSNNLTDRKLLNWFSSRANNIIRSRRIADKDIDPNTASWIQRPLEFAAQKLGEEGDVEEVGINDTARSFAPMAFVYALWIAIFTSAQMLLNNMVEEKSNRVLEVLLSSISAVELMGGKIAGMAASGLTVVFFWALTLFSIVVLVPAALGIDPTGLGPFKIVAKVAADPLYLVSFLVYFVMGYLFYATLLAGIGAVCNSIKETQHLMMPVIVPMLIPLLAMFSIVQDPNGILARILSFIPPFTPFIMMNRAAGPPEVWEYAATSLLMVATIILTLRGTAKVFRIGILMTGKPPKLMEMVKWFAMREGTAPPQREEA